MTAPRMKICLTCRGDPKPLSAFYKNRSRSDGYHSSCRACMRAYQGGDAALRNQRRAEKHRAIAHRQQLYAPERRSRDRPQSAYDFEAGITEPLMPRLDFLDRPGPMSCISIEGRAWRRG